MVEVNNPNFINKKRLYFYFFIFTISLIALSTIPTLFIYNKLSSIERNTRIQYEILNTLYDLNDLSKDDIKKTLIALELKINTLIEITQNGTDS